MSKNEFYNKLRQRISAAYDKSGNRCGWRLLASPSSVLEGADVAFIGLNPGGSFQPADHAEFAMDQGSAYVVETWGGSYQPGTSPLQKQVRALFKGLSVEPERVLAGNLVPFRSPSWDRLESPDFSLQFGESLWADILQCARPDLVIGMGGQSSRAAQSYSRGDRRPFDPSRLGKRIGYKSNHSARLACRPSTPIAVRDRHASEKCKCPSHAFRRSLADRIVIRSLPPPDLPRSTSAPSRVPLRHHARNPAASVT